MKIFALTGIIALSLLGFVDAQAEDAAPASGTRRLRRNIERERCGLRSPVSRWPKVRCSANALFLARYMEASASVVD
jgi:hypothetical protein